MRVAPLDTPVPYPVFAYCGLLAWNFSASALRFAVTSLTANTNLVTKVYFPREIFPFSAVAVSLVDFAVASTVLVAMMVYYGIAPTAAMLLLPVVIAVHVAVHGRARAAAVDGEPVLSRRQVSVRGRDDGLDVRQRRRLPDRRRRRAGCGTADPR